MMNMMDMVKPRSKKIEHFEDNKQKTGKTKKIVCNFSMNVFAVS